MKLTEILARYEVEELLEAHDAIVKNYYPDTSESMEVTENEMMADENHPVYKINTDNGTNIKIIRIDKANEPLVRRCIEIFFLKIVKLFN